ncbi:type I restriction endonuclease subunit R [Candidatus Saccharibacteria bacterium]|nr:type I restriction endonuclease subunit R [Candidatus Saccharibacteria bacterium]
MIDFDFDEVNESQFPAVELLIKLGWKYLSREEVDKARNGDRRKVILTDIAKDALMRINDYDGKKFDEPDIAGKVDELENTEFNGLIDTCREISDRIMPKLGGGTIKVFENGAYQDRSIRYFDFDNPENNDYHITVEYKVDGNEENLRADIILFINGIPIAEIENKKSSVGYTKAIDQLHRYQHKEYSPKFYTFLQLLIAMDGLNAVYGTTNTPDEFFVGWREKDLGLEKTKTKIEEILSTNTIDEATLNQIKQDLNGYVKPIDSRKFLPQDELIYGMLRKDRISDIIRNFVFYDGLHKKVARYQQYFAVKKTLKQIKTMDPKNPNRRKGGIIWHTQGSGKSLTMVMLVRALIEDEEIKNPRVIIVTDRINLDKQIKDTFENGGLKKNIVRTVSGEDLLRRIKNKDDSVLTTIIDKFNSASNRSKSFTDTDKDIFVLVDEAHRSQSGEANLKMLQMIPNACYIAFTGTPLLKKQKTENKFGEFIDKYTIDDALADKVIVPLIYEGRFIPLEQDENAINRKSERLLSNLTDEQREKIGKKVEKEIRSSKAGIEEICYDIAKHYERTFQNTGLKAEIVAPNKKSALQMQKWFAIDDHIKTALVISDENGEISTDEEDKLEVKEYLDDIKYKYSSLKSYEEFVVDDFTDNNDGIEALIVVDKLLTGFDAPRNTVLYLAKPLKDHNLLQAIARVNRVFSNKNQKIEKTAGYIVDYSSNAAAIKEAMALFGNFDPEDVHGTLIDPAEKKAELEEKYQNLLDIFRGKELNSQQDYIELLRDEATRRDFIEQFNSLLNTFAEYSCLRDIDGNFVDSISKDLKKFVEIKRSACLEFGDQIDLRQYERELARIANEHISAKEAEILIEPIDINNSEEFKKAISNLSSDKSRAEAIAAQTERRITEIFKAHGDVVLWQKFSDRIQAIIDALREEKLADIEALKQLSLITDEINSRKDDELPEAIQKQNGADILYRNLKDIVPSEQYDKYILSLAKIIQNNAIIDWWKNYDQKRIIENYLDDYIYDNMQVPESTNKKIREKVLELAENNYTLFGE